MRKHTATPQQQADQDVAAKRQAVAAANRRVDDAGRLRMQAEALADQAAKDLAQARRDVEHALEQGTAPPDLTPLYAAVQETNDQCHAARNIQDRALAALQQAEADAAAAVAAARRLRYAAAVAKLAAALDAARAANAEVLAIYTEHNPPTLPQAHWGEFTTSASKPSCRYDAWRRFVARELPEAGVTDAAPASGKQAAGGN